MLLHSVHPSPPTSHIPQVEVAEDDCRRAKFSEVFTGGNRLWAYTLLASITTDRKMAEVRILFMSECRSCSPGEIAGEVYVVQFLNSAINHTENAKL